MKRFTPSRIFGVVVSAAIIVVATVIIYISIVPIDVLEDWTLTTDKKEYVSGDNMLVTSQFSKVRAVTGVAKRYIECKNSQGKFNTRIPISEGVADRPQGAGGSDLFLHIPLSAPATTCRISVTVQYDIYTFRKFTESNSSNEFEVKPREINKDSPTDKPNQQDDNAVVENSPARNNARVETLPGATPNNSAQEQSPVQPPNNAVLCRLPIVTPLVIKPIIGVC